MILPLINQAEYYILESNKDSCLFSWDQRSGKFGMGKPAEYTEPVKMRLGEPIPDQPNYLDLHEAPAPVVSKSVAEVLAPLNIYGIQLVPAHVRHSKDPFSDIQHYWFIHIWHRISCLDRDKSELELLRTGSIFGIDKLVIDEKALDSFELKNRLIFELAEKTSIVFIHQSIKEAIMSVNPTGFRFINATEWHSDIAFD